MSREPSDPRRDPIYVAILAVLVGSVVVGALVAIVGDTVYHSEAMRKAGAGLAVVSGVVYFVFRILGRRAAGRRAGGRRDGGGPDDRNPDDG